MLNCMSEGCRVWFSRSNDPKRKLPGSWEISETPQGRLACINTARANALVEEALRAGLISELNGFTALKREVPYGVENSRADFRLDFPQGPTFVEAYTYRMGAHTTSDDPTKYRTSDEEESWARRDPIARMRAYLERRGASAEFFADVEAESQAVADDARVRTNALGGIDAETMFAHVYSADHPVIAEQREWLASYEASFQEGDR